MDIWENYDYLSPHRLFIEKNKINTELMTEPLIQYEDNKIHLLININVLPKGEFTLKIVLPFNYPDAPPRVFIIEPTEIKYGMRPHIMNDGSLSTHREKEWLPNYSIASAIILAANWIKEFF